MNDNPDRGRGPRRPWCQRGRVVAAITVLSAIALLAAACGSGTPSATSAATPGQYASALAYATCMRSHGVLNFPDPDSQGNFSFSQNPSGGSRRRASGVSKQTMNAALHACAHLLRSGHQGTPQQLRQKSDVALQYARCMRTHGFPNFPDPTQNSHGTGFDVHGIDIHSPRFQSASHVCQSWAVRKVTGQRSPGSGS